MLRNVCGTEPVVPLLFTVVQSIARIPALRKIKHPISFGRAVVLVTPEGTPVGNWVIGDVGAESKENFRTTMGFEIFPVLMAMQFGNCKNVELVAQTPCEKLSRSFQRKHGKPLNRFHTIEIDPMRKLLESEGEVKRNGLKKALHICRGHFAHYTPEKPLFGRISGNFWVPAHVRGAKEHGTVKKDYVVKAPT